MFVPLGKKAVDGAAEVGKWMPEVLPEQDSDRSKPRNKVTLEWDVSRFISRPGSFRFTFIYQKGRNRLDIDYAALFQDENEISRDEHFGFTGHEEHHNIYDLYVKQHDPGATYILRAQVWGGGGKDSSGRVLLLKD
jgi:hypothetical protein